MRGVDVFLNTMSAASALANIEGLKSVGCDMFSAVIHENRVDAKTLLLTPNTQTATLWAFLNLKDGPIVVEVPPGVLGLADDLWMRYIVDLGLGALEIGTGAYPGNALANPAALLASDRRLKAFKEAIDRRNLVISGIAGDFAQAAHVRARRRRAAGHRFEKDDAETFAGAGQDEEVSGAVPARKLRCLDLPDETHGVGHVVGVLHIRDGSIAEEEMVANPTPPEDIVW